MVLQRIEDHEYDPIEHDLGTPIHDQLKGSFVWHVRYGDEDPETTQIRAITDGTVEGVIVEGTDRATRKSQPEDDDRPTPRTMPATIVRPEIRVKARRTRR